jgi:hypothetical protein
VPQVSKGAGTPISAAFQKLLRNLRPVETVLRVLIGIRQICHCVSFCKPKATLLHEVADASDCGINRTSTVGCPRDTKSDAGSRSVWVTPRELGLAGLLAEAPAPTVLKLYLPAQDLVPGGWFWQGADQGSALAQNVAQI